MMIWIAVFPTLLLNLAVAQQDNSYICKLPISKGKCIGFWRRWGSIDGRCVSFIYTGCASNANNFKSLKECEQKCPPSVPSAPVPRCQQSLLTGTCPEGSPTQFLDRWGSLAGACGPFTFSGCGGNENNFLTQAECEQACPSTVAQVLDFYQDAKPLPIVKNFLVAPKVVSPTQGVCALPLKAGRRCHSKGGKFYGNKNGRCVKFRYRGCGGNSNRFKTKFACETKCGNSAAFASLKLLKCNKKPPKGPSSCKVPEYRYIYNSETDKCTQYVGCRGGGIGFRKLKRCESLCMGS